MADSKKDGGEVGPVWEAQDYDAIEREFHEVRS